MKIFLRAAEILLDDIDMLLAPRLEYDWEFLWTMTDTFMIGTGVNGEGFASFRVNLPFNIECP